METTYCSQKGFVVYYRLATVHCFCFNLVVSKYSNRGVAGEVTGRLLNLSELPTSDNQNASFYRRAKELPIASTKVGMCYPTLPALVRP